jgi:hypothetical protein
MKTSKLLAMLVVASGGAALAGVLSAGCTIKTVDCNVTPNDPICLTPDSSTKPDAGGDAAKPDSGGSDGGVCPQIGQGGLVDFSSLGAQCNSCMQNNCCSPTVACFSDVGDGGTNIDVCADLYQCYVDCNTGCGNDNTCLNTCYNQCDTDHPKSIAKYNAYESCLTSKCNTECP